MGSCAVYCLCVANLPFKIEGGERGGQCACKPLRQGCSKAPSSVTGLNYATSLAVLIPNEVDTGQGQAENNAGPESQISGGDWVMPAWSSFVKSPTW